MANLKLVLAAMLTLPVIAGCTVSCSTHGNDIDAKALAAKLEAAMKADGLPVERVECPSGVEGRSGATLTCGVDMAGKRYDQIVKLRASGLDTFDTESTWARGEAIVTSKLVAILEAQARDLGGTATIDCGEPLRFLEPDRTVRCDYKIGSVQTRVKCTFDRELKVVGIKTDARLISRIKVEEVLLPSVREKLGPDTTFQCDGEPVQLTPADNKLSCTARRGRDTIPIVVEGETSAKGSFVPQSWHPREP